MKTLFRSLTLACAVIGCILVTFRPASGVIIGTGDGTGNTSRTNADGDAMPAGWDNVGKLGDASAVYLGNGWGITAYHVDTNLGSGSHATFGGTSYTIDQIMRLTTHGPNSQTTGLADLQMFHLTATPNLPTLTIPTASPTAGTFIYMVGYGRNRAEDLTYYNVISDNQPSPTYTWTETSESGANYGGFKYASGNTKRWGTNRTTDDPQNPGNLTAIANVSGNGPTQVFFANFYDDLGDYQASQNVNYSGDSTDSEAQLVSGDSGGGVFDAAGNLIGLNNYAGNILDQPPDTAVFGDYSEMADLSAYRTQIVDTMNTTVPEPTSLALVAVGGLALLSRKRRGCHGSRRSNGSKPACSK